VRTWTKSIWTAVALCACVSGSCAQVERARAQRPSDTEREHIEHARSLSDAFKYAARTIEPSVVHITSRRLVQNVSRDIFGRTTRQGPSRLQDAGLGSGVIIDASGVILTNHHVVSEADELVVRLADDREYPAELVGSDAATDIAVLRIEAENLVAAELGDSESVEVGEWVLAIGSPFGFDQTVTAGIVSAKGRAGIGVEEGARYQEFLQTDASINPGNSGGPLVTLDGKVVGINTAILSRTGGSVGIGFAIPSAMARTVSDFILTSGRVERGYLGIEMEDLDPARAQELGLPASAARGVLVTRVSPGSPAADAGLAVGDVIVSIDGRAATNLNRLRNLIALTPPGREIAIGVLREGRERSIPATLVNRDRAIAAAIGGVYLDPLDAAVRDLDRDIARQLGFNRVFPGAVVVNIDEDGPAGRAGLRVGDVIVEVDGEPIDGASDVLDRLTRSPGTARLGLVRGRMRGTLDVELE
jgi:Do/DeqQ family serine protease